MDPLEFGLSSLPLHHKPYSPISTTALKNTNEGKVALITGAAGGIGAAIALSLALSGSDVALLDLNLASLRSTKKACEDVGVRVGVWQGDVTDEIGMRKLVEEAEKDMGNIDILINNAGICEMRPFSMSSADSIWRQVEVNLKGPIILTHLILPKMIVRRNGCIINIASRSGTVDVPMFLGYNTSKAALIRMASTLQKEIEMEVDLLENGEVGIGVYAVHPGGVLTGMAGAETDPDVQAKYNIVKDETFYKDLFKDTPELCGQTCAFLAAGRGKDLRGLYLDCRQDIENLLEVGREELKKRRLNTLGVKFLEGYCNEP